MNQYLLSRGGKIKILQTYIIIYKSLPILLSSLFLIRSYILIFKVR